jgi:hypothetical protein
VSHWRITRCKHVPKRKQKNIFAKEEEEEGKAADVDDYESSGSESHEEYYYYEEEDSTKASTNCVHSQHDVSKGKPFHLTPFVLHLLMTYFILRQIQSNHVVQC